MPAIIPAILGAVSAAGTVAGKAGEKRAEGRAAEAQLNAERDRIAANNYATQQQAQLQQRNQQLNERQFALNAPSTRLSQLIRGNILQSAMDPHTSVAGIPETKTTGGLRPSMFSDEAKQGGGALVQQALSGLMSGDKFDPMTLLTPPSQTPLPQAGRADSILNGLGYGGAFAGALAPFLGRRAPVATPGATPTQLFGNSGNFGGVHF